MIVAKRAIELIKALNLPASPRIYEPCYAYDTGEYPSLNLAINDLLTRRVAVGGEQIGARSAVASNEGAQPSASRVT